MNPTDVTIDHNKPVSDLLYNIREQVVSVIYNYLKDENDFNDIIESGYNFNTIWLDCSHEHYIKINQLYYNKNTNGINLKLETKDEIYTYYIDCSNIKNPIIRYKAILDWYNWFRSFIIDKITEL